MSHEVNFTPEIETRLSEHARQTGQDVVHLIQVAVAEFIEQKAPSDDNLEWNDELNDRRCQLIDKDLNGKISVRERIELVSLQKRAEKHFDKVAPPPMETVTKLYAELLAKVNQANGNH